MTEQVIDLGHDSAVDRSEPWRRLGFRGERDLAVWSDYVRQVADVLELRDWTIIANPEPPEVDFARAQVFPVYGRKIATLRWQDDLRAESSIITRQALVHELVHLHVQPMAEVIEGGQGGDGLFPELGGPVYRAVYQHFSVALERAVDGLADVIAPSVPFIEWGRDKYAAPATLLWMDDGRVWVGPYREERPREGVASVQPGAPLDPPATGLHAPPGPLSRDEQA